MTRGKMWGKIKSWCEQQLEAASAEQFWPAYKRVDVRGQPPVPHLRFALPIKEGEAWGSSPVVLFWIEVYQLLETASFNPPGIWIAVWQRTEASRTHGPHVVGFTTDGDIQENTFNNGGLFWRAVEHLVGSGRAATPMLPPLSPSGQADQPVHKRAEANDQAAQPQPAGVIEYDAGGNLRLCSYQPGDDDLTRYLPLLQVAPEGREWGFEDAEDEIGGLLVIERFALASNGAPPFIGAWSLAGPWSEIGRVAADGTISTDDKTLAERLRRLAEASKE